MHTIEKANDGCGHNGKNLMQEKPLAVGSYMTVICNVSF